MACLSTSSRELSSAGAAPRRTAPNNACSEYFVSSGTQHARQAGAERGNERETWKEVLVLHC